MANSCIRWIVAGLCLLGVILLPFILLEDRMLALAGTLDRLSAAPVALSLAVFAALALDVFLPVPSSLVMLFAGAAIGPVTGLAVTWGGLTAGCLLGYAAGAGAGRPIARWWLGSEALETAMRRVARFGTVPLVVARPIPVLAEASTLVAGATRYPFGRFLALTSLSNAVVAGVYVGLAAIAPEAHLLAFAVAGVAWLALLFAGIGRLAKRRAPAARQPDD